MKRYGKICPKKSRSENYDKYIVLTTTPYFIDQHCISLWHRLKMFWIVHRDKRCTVQQIHDQFFNNERPTLRTWCEYKIPKTSLNSNDYKSHFNVPISMRGFQCANILSRSSFSTRASRQFSQILTLSSRFFSSSDNSCVFFRSFDNFIWS